MTGIIWKLFSSRIRRTEKDILICSSFDSIDRFLLYVVLWEKFAAIR